eukprot:3996260-Amphidinium_carterae.1
MSGRGKGDGKTGSSSSSQRDERPPLQRFRPKAASPEAQLSSGGEASSSSMNEDRTYQSPPPDMSRGPPWGVPQRPPLQKLSTEELDSQHRLLLHLQTRVERMEEWFQSFVHLHLQQGQW